MLWKVNGSFVQNRHNYTILDMHTNLGHINRLQEINITNPDIKFPKRKDNNDFIWDKQFPQDRGKWVCDLKDYPSEKGVGCAWKELVEVWNAETSDSDDHDDDDKKWFYKPMDYVNFKEPLKRP